LHPHYFRRASVLYLIRYICTKQIFSAYFCLFAEIIPVMRDTYTPLPADARARAEGLFLEGNRCMAEGAAAVAETHFRQALDIAPDFAEAHANLGLLLDRKKDYPAAEACYRRALALAPAAFQIHLNLGGLLLAQKRLAEAEATWRQAIALAPTHAPGWSNLGVLYACSGRDAEAENAYRTALALNENYATARFNFSYLLLRQGRLPEGWRYLEARSWQPARVLAAVTCPRWQGEPLAGKALLIAYEAGHGDMIQFCRYAAVLKAQGARAITLVCHPALTELFSTLRGVDAVVSLNDPIPAENLDYWTPLLSLPYRCGTLLDSIPAALPYLYAAPERVAKWASLIPAEGLRVGLVWKGNPNFENDADRSLPTLDILAPLWAVQGMRFISLQKGAGADEAAHPPPNQPLLDIGPALEDFADTAAAIMNLDLVICVDTAVAHLSGALNKPCWLLLPAYKPDWRWLTGRADTPWYPGVMRLFRQTTMGDWGAVVAKVAGALGETPNKA
jgi:Flp pilus assembly protein TadD